MDSRVQLNHIWHQIIIFPPRAINLELPWLNDCTNLGLPDKIRIDVLEAIDYILNHTNLRIIGKKW